MSTLFDRMGQVVKSEWNHRFGEQPDDEDTAVEASFPDDKERPRQRGSTASKPQVRRRGITDPEQAYRVL